MLPGVPGPVSECVITGGSPGAHIFPGPNWAFEPLITGVSGGPEILESRMIGVSAWAWSESLTVGVSGGPEIFESRIIGVPGGAWSESLTTGGSAWAVTCESRMIGVPSGAWSERLITGGSPGAHIFPGPNRAFESLMVGGAAGARIFPWPNWAFESRIVGGGPCAVLPQATPGAPTAPAKAKASAPAEATTNTLFLTACSSSVVLPPDCTLGSRLERP